MNTLLAHGGGIPETISVLVPLGIAVLLIRMSARAKKEEESEQAEPGDEDVSR